MTIMTRFSILQRPLQITLILFAATLILPLTTGHTFALEQDLPTGESVLAKYVEVTGGQEAYDKISNRHFTGTIEIVNAGVVLDMEAWAAKPNKLIATINSDATGTIHKGCTGTAAWSMSDLQGPVIEGGASLENQLRDSLFDRIAYWKQVYQSAECIAIEKLNGSECYKVVLTPKPYKSEEAKDAEVSLMNVYFDKATHLANKIESNAVTAAGTINITAYLSDYKDVDGIKIPHTTKLELVGQTRIMTMTSFKHNLELADNHFDPPAEIQALLKKNRQKLQIEK